MTFKELGLHDQLIEALGHMNFEKATAIQEQAIPVILEGRDLIGCAQTGTGKTAAFLLPTLQMIAEGPQDGIKALIICPTRELAIQIDRQIQGLAYFIGVGSIAIYGGGNGENWDDQKKAITTGIDIIVATPGKLISHLNLGYVDFGNLSHLILDEADRMMDMGFRDDIVKIISYLPKKRQNLMFSATMPGKIRDMINAVLVDPFHINLAISKPAEGVLQEAYLVHDPQKPRLVARLLHEKKSLTKIIVFTSTKEKVKTVYKELRNSQYEVRPISSDLEQEEREEVLRGFVAGKYRVLVATDVISRGIDIKDIDLVINYDVPKNAEDYVHRVGRTARAATTGTAITFINERDMFAFAEIEDLIETQVQKHITPPDIGPSPEWNPSRKHFNHSRGNSVNRPTGQKQNKNRNFKKHKRPAKDGNGKTKPN